MQKRGVRGADEHLEPLLNFLPEHWHERLRKLARQDEQKFWKEMTSGKYAPTDRRICEVSEFKKLMLQNEGRIHYLSDDPNFEGGFEDSVDMAYNYVIAFGGRIYFSLEQKHIVY